MFYLKGKKKKNVDSYSNDIKGCVTFLNFYQCFALMSTCPIKNKNFSTPICLFILYLQSLQLCIECAMQYLCAQWEDSHRLYFCSWCCYLYCHGRSNLFHLQCRLGHCSQVYFLCDCGAQPIKSWMTQNYQGILFLPQVNSSFPFLTYDYKVFLNSFRKPSFLKFVCTSQNQLF